MPDEAKIFFKYGDELTVKNGVVYKVRKVVIPPLLQANMIERTHYSHVGSVARLRRARDALFGIGMAAEICEIYIEMPTKQ